MTELLNQQEVESRMYYGGIKRAEAMMANAEEGGRAVNNPYAREVLDEYVLPLAAAIRSELSTKRAGKRVAHVSLLAGLDEEAVAYLAVRTTLNHLLMQGGGQHRQVAYAIGRAVHSELVLTQIEEHSPDLYHTLARDFGRRLSKDERHRMTVFKMQAAKQGILLIEWPVGARDQVGLYLLGLLEVAGMIEIDPAVLSRNKMQPREVRIAYGLLQRIDEIKSYVAITMPVYGPCVEPPKDWVNPNDGGFHTRELRRTHPTLVRHRLARTAMYREAQMPLVLDAVNTLQRTAWQVNNRMLNIVLEVAQHFNAGEITSVKEGPKPEPPSWLATVDSDRTTWTEDQTLQFKRWKRTMAEWYTQRKLMGTKYGRFYSATRAAEMFKDYPSIYFVYFADSRGRLYPMTYGLNPQGSDLQKGLLRFAEGLPLDTPEAIRWFHVQGANKWGFDKATLKDRHQWVVERQDLILSFAADPVNNVGWRDADSPLQFLAWCLEYADWVNDQTDSFVSHLPISMDGSCNGLQNLSALLRDEIGGQATNLTNNAEMADIYRKVADAAMIRLKAMTFEEPEKEVLRLKWVAHGVTRSVVKRSVMTTPYGVTQRSATDYVVEDYLRKEANPFEHTEYVRAAAVLMAAVWPAIGDIVVKGREAMAWLQRCARLILKTLDPEDPVISWTSPSGFPASQAYYAIEVHRINTRLHGVSKIRVVTEIDEPDDSKHVNGLAPNFVHSMDAAHLHLTAASCRLRGIDAVAMIHDDYGVHAANAQKLFDIIRERFVWMYEHHDPIQAFADRYPCSPPAPDKGALDIREVLTSAYFFS